MMIFFSPSTFYIHDKSDFVKMKVKLIRLLQQQHLQAMLICYLSGTFLQFPAECASWAQD